MSKKTGILADDGRANAAAKADARYSRQFAEDLRMIAASPQGRRFIGRLIFNECKVMVSEQWDPSARMHYIAGRRSIGEGLLGILEESAPAETRRLVDEWFNERYEWRTSIERAAGKPDGDEDGE